MSAKSNFPFETRTTGICILPDLSPTPLSGYIVLNVDPVSDACGRIGREIAIKEDLPALRRSATLYAIFVVFGMVATGRLRRSTLSRGAPAWDDGYRVGIARPLS
jgi:hypothetical protein